MPKKLPRVLATLGSILWKEDTFCYRLDNMSARTDRGLVQAYAASQDEAAFEELVSRHQGLVFQSCMRMLSNAHDAQEAAQSVFIVLSRKARSLRREGALNGWLHDVARKVCLKALRLRAREAEKEADAMTWQESEKAASSSGTDTEALLRSVDHELAGLSTVLREAVLLRHMQGYSEKAAAEMAGCPVGTLSRRASEGIAKLRARLAKRGIALGLPALAAALESEAQAAMPETLLSSTMTAVKAYAATGAATAAVSTGVVTLTKGVLNMMFWNGVKVGVAVAVGIAAVVGGGLAAHRAIETYSTKDYTQWTLEKRFFLPSLIFGISVHRANNRSSDWCAVFSPDGTLVAEAGGDSDVLLWDVKTGTVKTRLVGHTDGVRHVVFSSDGTHAATAGDDSTVRVWDTATGRSLHVLSGHKGDVRFPSFSPDGSRLLTAGRDGTARLWSTTTGVQEFQFSVYGNADRDVVFSPDGKRVLTGSQGSEAVVWDSLTHERLFDLKGHKRGIACVCFSPDGRLIATGGYDQIARLWDSATGRQLLTLEGHTSIVSSVTFSSAGDRIATVGEESVRIWDTLSGRQLLQLGCSGSAMPAAFSPDGGLVANVDRTYTGTLWDSRTGEILWSMNGVTWISFSPDSRRIAVARAAGGSPVEIWVRSMAERTEPATVPQSATGVRERRDNMKYNVLGDEIEKARKAGKSVHVFTKEDKTQMEAVFREVVARFGRQNVTIMNLSSLDDSRIPDSDIVVGRWTNFGFAYARRAIMENHRADVDALLAKTHCVVVGVDDVVQPCVISTKVDGVQKILASVSFADLTNKYGTAIRIPEPTTTSTDQAL